MSEEECYLRCYGWEGPTTPSRSSRPVDPSEQESPAALTERIRLAFEARLEAREPEAA